MKNISKTHKFSLMGCDILVCIGCIILTLSLISREWLNVGISATILLLGVVGRILFKKKFELKASQIRNRAPISTYVALILWGIWLIVPLWVVFVTSFKSVYEASGTVFTWLPRQGWHLDAYIEVITGNRGGISIFTGFKNSILFMLAPLFIGTFVSAMSAFGFAKLKFKGSNVLFGILISTMMLPGCVNMMSTFMIYDALNWVDTPLPIIIPGLFGNIGCVFFLKQYMRFIPDDLIQSSRIDGLGVLGCYVKIILPLAFPAIAAQLVLGFFGHFNDYLAPLIYLISPEMYTLQIALRFYSNSLEGEWPIAMACCVIALLPTLVVFMIFQKMIVEGTSIGSGLKG